MGKDVRGVNLFSVERWDKKHLIILKKRASFIVMLFLLLVPLIAFSLKGARLELEAKITPSFTPLRGNILDRTGTLLAFSPSSPVRDRDQSPAIDAIHAATPPKRIYPYNDMARDIIGAVDRFYTGISGIELLMNRQLSNAQDVFLTLERESQLRADEMLNAHLRRLRASSGCLVIMDVDTGGVIAASYKGALNLQDGLLSASLISLPIRWLTTSSTCPNNGLRRDDLITDKGAIRWIEAEADGRLRLWSPWSHSFLQGFSREKHSITKELIELGIGEGHGKVPVFSYRLFEEELKSTALNILSAFSSLINKTGPISPCLVLHTSDNTISSNAVCKANNNKGQISWLTQEKKDKLKEALSSSSAPSIVSVLKNKDSRSPKYEMVSLGYWPKDNPRLAYIYAIKDAKIDPVRKRAAFTGVKTILKKGVSLLEKSNTEFLFGMK